MSQAQISIITKPVGLEGSALKVNLKAALRDARDLVMQILIQLGLHQGDGLRHHGTLAAGGPNGVIRSLLAGLKVHKFNFNFDPVAVSQLASTVIVMSDVGALEQMIDLKKRRRISHLIAGPNLVVRSTHANSILASAEIDKIIVPSTWVAEAYVDEVKNLASKIIVWPAGVDTEFWRPTAGALKNKKSALLYWKTEPEVFCQNVEQFLHARGFEVKRFKYGKHTREQYRDALTQSNIAVFISRSESQGLALAEAWSTDVATLVWNPEQLQIDGYQFKSVSACPYLSPATGAAWKTIDELSALLDQPPVHSRPWVLKNMGDAVAGAAFIEIVKKVWHQAQNARAPHASA